MRRKKKNTEELTVSEVPVYGEDPKPQKEKIDILDITKPKAVREPPKNRKERNRAMVKASYFMVAMFLSLVVYLVYFNVIRADSINSNAYNTKQSAKENMIIRGAIYSADGQPLAITNVDAGGNESRVYPYYQTFSHVVGYATNGRSGIESVYNDELLTCSSSILQQIEDSAQNVKVRGDSLYLTLNTSLQRAAYDALGNYGYNGAVVVLEPDTGKILAMVSRPGFDPNTISQDWDILVSDEANSPLLNRATQGLYPPGSTFKVLTTLAYIRENPDDYQNFTFNCQGLVSMGDVNITCYGGSVHGSETLEQAFMNSCNGAFATIGTELEYDAYRDICEDFFFNDSIDLVLPTSESQFELESGSSVGEQMTTAIGQGDTLATPLQMAMVAAAVANNGTIMKPYLLDYIATYDGDVVREYNPSSYRTVMSSAEAEILAGYMTSTAQSGTASALSGNGYTVAGKTGSAEYEIDGSENMGTHSWFIGYSNVEDPDIAIAVIAENGGSGSSTAVPIAKYIFDAYYYGY